MLASLRIFLFPPFTFHLNPFLVDLSQPGTLNSVFKLSFYAGNHMQKPTLSTALSILNANAPLTMSSLEIAKLTGKRHDHVLADIRAMLEGLEIEATEFSGAYKMPSGQNTTLYSLPKRECFILVSGYNLKLRAAIIDRWQELEGTGAKPLSQIEQVRLLLESLEREEELKNLIAEGKYLSVKNWAKLNGGVNLPPNGFRWATGRSSAPFGLRSACRTL